MDGFKRYRSLWILVFFLIPGGCAHHVKIPINGTTTSFYHEDGPLKGHVKDSVKIWESLFLGLISMDLYVGADKAYEDTGETGNPFYTSLKPWNRNASDMWHFRKFLEFWGWKL
ncbi:MAG: hypothetical protein ABFR82_03450 [Nitrospirota bacterium]